MLHAKTSRMICDSNLVSSLRLKRGIQAKKSTTNDRRNTLFPRPRPLAGFGNYHYSYIFMNHPCPPMVKDRVVKMKRSTLEWEFNLEIGRIKRIEKLIYTLLFDNDINSHQQTSSSSSSLTLWSWIWKIESCLLLSSCFLLYFHAELVKKVDCTRIYSDHVIYVVDVLRKISLFSAFCLSHNFHSFCICHWCSSELCSLTLDHNLVTLMSLECCFSWRRFILRHQLTNFCLTSAENKIKNFFLRNINSYRRRQNWWDKRKNEYPSFVLFLANEIHCKLLKNTQKFNTI